MEEIYGFHSGGSDHYSNHNNYLFYPVDTDDDGGGGDYYRFAGFHDGRVPIVLGGHQYPEVPSAVSDAASTAVTAVGDRREDDISGAIRARIAAHPLYPKLLQAYIDCRKVGAPPDIAGLLEDMEHENDVSGRLAVSSCLGADPELDEFMEAYCHLLAKYKSDLSRPFDEATTFLNHIETQLSSLCSNAATATSSHISEVTRMLARARLTLVLERTGSFAFTYYWSAPGEHLYTSKVAGDQKKKTRGFFNKGKDNNNQTPNPRNAVDLLLNMNINSNSLAESG